MLNKIMALLYFSFLGLSLYAQTTGEIFSNALSLYQSRDYAKAANQFRRVLALINPTDTTNDAFIEQIMGAYTQSLLNIGAYDEIDSMLSSDKYRNNYILQNNRASALGYKQDFEKALDVLNSILEIPDVSPVEKGKTYQNQGFLLMDMGYYSEAEVKLNISLNYLNGIAKVIAKSNLALCDAHLGKFQEAIQLIDESINVLYSNLPDYLDDYLICLRKKAEIYSMSGKITMARSLYQNYFESSRLLIISKLTTLSSIDRLNLWLKEKPLLSKCFMLENFAPEFLYEVAMFRRQTSLLGMHDTNSLKNILSAKPNDIRKQLQKSEAAIEFISYKDKEGTMKYAAIILPKNGKIRFVKLFNEEYIYEPEVVGGNSIINAVKSNTPTDKNLLYTDTLLANSVWRPIISVLSTEVKTLYFAPEGIFHFWGIENMPFNGHEKYTLHRITSTASLISPHREKVKLHSAMLLGGLNYSILPEDSIKGSYNHEAAELIRQKTGKNNLFQYLPGTLAEVDSINSFLSDADLNHQIGEARLKMKLPQYNIIHIATHGYSLNMGILKRSEFSSDSLAYDFSLNATGLALTGANIAVDSNDLEDGVLSAREICDLDLSNVEFVVLSACQTAHGNIIDEGAAGLVRGLKNAGVKTVMATLWSVDDKSTMLFMQEFYRLLASGNSKYEAYIGAQNYLRHYVDKTPRWKFSPKTLAREKTNNYVKLNYDAPYYWAPFILID